MTFITIFCCLPSTQARCSWTLSSFRGSRWRCDGFDSLWAGSKPFLGPEGPPFVQTLGLILSSPYPLHGKQWFIHGNQNEIRKWSTYWRFSSPFSTEPNHGCFVRAEGEFFGETQLIQPMTDFVFFIKFDKITSFTIHVWYIYLHLVDLYGKCR